MKNLTTKLVPALLGLFATVVNANAIIMFDFGDAATYTGTNSPGHAVGAIPLSHTTWTGVSGVDGSAQDSQGNTLTFDLGRAPAQTQSDNWTLANGINWDSQPASRSAAAGAGIWGTDLTRDSIIDVTSNHRRDPVAMRISGLALGEYELFLVAHESGNLSVPLTARTVVSSATLNRFSDFSTTLASDFTPDVDTGTWTEGSDFVRHVFNITATDQSLYVGVGNSNNTASTNPTHNATISSLQIVAIPEPGTLALVGMFLGAVLLFRRR